MADIEELKTYYSDLLIVQYKQKEKARATIALLVEQVLADGIIFDVLDGYDLDSAVGEQLDVLGKWVGVDRFFDGADYGDSVFGFADAVFSGGVSSYITGFDDATLLNKNGIFLDAEQAITTGLRLNDDAFRILIRFKILQNNIDHSDKAINDALFATFGNTIFAKDNLDMTMTYFIGNVDSVLVDAIFQKDLLLRPMGVGVQTVILSAQSFGFADAANLNATPPYIIGFNDATNGLIKEGVFINAENDVLYP